MPVTPAPASGWRPFPALKRPGMGLNSFKIPVGNFMALKEARMKRVRDE